MFMKVLKPIMICTLVTLFTLGPYHFVTYMECRIAVYALGLEYKDQNSYDHTLFVCKQKAELPGYKSW